jgi:hypothetical protein
VLAAFSCAQFLESLDSALHKDSAKFSTLGNPDEFFQQHEAAALCARQQRTGSGSPRGLALPACTKSGHWLVERLHSAAFKADTLSRFSLTPGIGRVKP